MLSQEVCRKGGPHRDLVEAKKCYDRPDVNNFLHMEEIFNIIQIEI